ncbi:MAG TPA: DUF5602 domain-containing protein [Phycisphaerales bacterium]|nr:DUF5602 domain-containing protein [Phycisphaerales bacterium]
MTTSFANRRHGLVILAAALTLGAAAAGGSILDLSPNPDLAAAAGFGTPGMHTRYGASVTMGNGMARTYVLVDGMTGNPVEVGVALSEKALEGLPEHLPPAAPGAHGAFSEYLLELPGHNPTPYKFVEVDWNPHGHGGPYVAPHFDFHFYRVPLATRNEIDLGAPDFETKAARLPSGDEFPATYASSHVLLNTTPAGMTVPRMGLHWVDTQSPELPPQNKPFTATYIMGSWNGQVIFDEPMVTRDFILAQRTGPATAAEIAVPAAKRYVPSGFYPASYGIRWDEKAREYRIALQGLEKR